MKKFMLVAALIAATFTAAFAQRPEQKSVNDANRTAGHKALVAKTAELEANIKSHNHDAAQAAAMDCLALMKKGVQQTRFDAEYMPHGKEQDARMDHMLQMEHMIHNFIEYTKDIHGSGDKLVAEAKTYLAAY
jgi:hypothetical protein